MKLWPLLIFLFAPLSVAALGPAPSGGTLSLEEALNSARQAAELGELRRARERALIARTSSRHSAGAPSLDLELESGLGGERSVSLATPLPLGPWRGQVRALGRAELKHLSASSRGARLRLEHQVRLAFFELLYLQRRHLVGSKPSLLNVILEE